MSILIFTCSQCRAEVHIDLSDIDDKGDLYEGDTYILECDDCGKRHIFEPIINPIEDDEI